MLPGGVADLPAFPQEFHYENADAANSGFSSASSEIKRFQRSVPTARQLEASKARWQEKSFSDVASAVGEDEEEDDEARELFGLGRVPARAMHSKRSHAALADMEGSSPRSRLARQRLAGNDESERGRPSEELEQEEEENHLEDDDVSEDDQPRRKQLKTGFVRPRTSLAGRKVVTRQRSRSRRRFPRLRRRTSRPWQRHGAFTMPRWRHSRAPNCGRRSTSNGPSTFVARRSTIRPARSCIAPMKKQRSW